MQQHAAAPKLPWWLPLVVGVTFGLGRLLADNYKYALGSDGVAVITLGIMAGVQVVAGVVGWLYASGRTAGDGPLGEEGGLTSLSGAASSVAAGGA
jgi:hypothetical protein